MPALVAPIRRTQISDDGPSLRAIPCEPGIADVVPLLGPRQRTQLATLASRLHLPMPRADIANYLGLAAETVSLVLRRFQTEGLINVDRREMEILDMARLTTLAAPVLRS